MVFWETIQLLWTGAKKMGLKLVLYHLIDLHRICSVLKLMIIIFLRL